MYLFINNDLSRHYRPITRKTISPKLRFSRNFWFHSSTAEMNHRKDIYVERLGLIPLSEEGGYFGGTYRSPEQVQVEDREGGYRSLFTTIYYLIVPELGGKNYFNRNKSDITHYFHDGWPAKYIYITPEGDMKEYTLGKDILKGHVLQLIEGSRQLSESG